MGVQINKAVRDLLLSIFSCGLLALSCQPVAAQVKTPGTAIGGGVPGGYVEGFVSQLLVRSYGVHVVLLSAPRAGSPQGIDMSCFSSQSGGGKFLPVVFTTDPQYQTLLASLRDALIFGVPIRIYSDGCYRGSATDANFQWPYIAALDVINF